MILRENTTDKSYEFVRVLNRESRNINETDLVVKFIIALNDKSLTTFSQKDVFDFIQKSSVVFGDAASLQDDLILIIFS